MRLLGSYTVASVLGLASAGGQMPKGSSIGDAIAGGMKQLETGAAFVGLSNTSFASLASGYDVKNLKDVVANLSGVAVVPVVHSILLPPSSSPLSPSSRDLSTGGFVCESFGHAYDPTRFCSGIVDYPYVLPDGYTDAILETTARTYARLMGIPFFKATCLTDVKRYICANVYAKCAANGE